MGSLHSQMFYTNTTLMDAWIEKAARFTFNRGMDGIMLDIEGAPGVSSAQFAAFGCKLREGLHKFIPGAVVRLQPGGGGGEGAPSWPSQQQHAESPRCL